MCYSQAGFGFAASGWPLTGFGFGFWAVVQHNHSVGAGAV